MMSDGKPLHIGVAGPIATEHVRAWLDDSDVTSPVGYTGAPLTGVLIGELLRRGHRVSAFTMDTSMPPGSRPVVLRGQDFQFHVCPGRPRSWRPNGTRPGRIVNLFADERAVISQQMRSASPQVIHAHWTYEFALAALDTAIPHLVTCHDSPAAVLRFTRSPYRALRYLMARQVLARATRITAVSGYMASEVQRYARCKIDVVPNPLAGYVLEQGTPRPSPAGRSIALVCNGWDRRKNPGTAMLAFARYRSREPAAGLHMFGHDFGPGQFAQRWAAKQGVEAGMTFHGALDHRELVARLSACDALVHTALEESFGVVIAEAMALGLPVVAGTHSGAVPWVMGASAGASPCGELVDVSSVSEVLAGIDRVFGPAYASKSAAGHAMARSRFAPAVIVDRYLAHYSEAFASSSSSPGPGNPLDRAVYSCTSPDQRST